MLATTLLALITARSAKAQAPGLAWSNNVGATVFATDASGNVYANASGTVKVLNSSGTLIQTITACPLPGFALRDASGNFYFSGSFGGTQDLAG